MDSIRDNNPLVTERRLATLEAKMQLIGNDLDEIKRGLSDLTQEFREFRGEVKGRAVTGNTLSAKMIDVFRHVIVALLGALFALIGVKYSPGG